MDISDSEEELQMDTNELQHLTICTSTSNQKSFVWKHFGDLTKNNKVIDKSKKYCTHCLKNKKLTKYSSSTSTSNLIRHLLNTHNIVDAESSVNTKGKQFKLTDLNFKKQENKNGNLNTRKDESYILARNIALWFARDNLPFNAVSRDGFRDFFTTYGLVPDGGDLPSPDTVGGRALEDLYLSIKDKIINMIDKIIHAVSLTFDSWTDNYKRLSYLTITLHFLNDEWKLISITLSTILFPHPHTAANIIEIINKVIIDFKLNNKNLKFICTTDRGSNMLKAVRDFQGIQNFCIGHSCHNLLTTDIERVSEEAGINKLFKKLKEIYRVLMFNYQDMKNLINAESQKNLIKMVEEIEGMEYLLLENDYSDVDQSKIKNNNLTRWNSSLHMLESFDKNMSIVTKMLEKLKKYQLIINNDEQKSIKGMIKILQVFKTASVDLQGVRYPTLNLILLFLEEIKHAINDLENEFCDDDYMCSLLLTIKKNITKRFCVSEEIIGCTLLDPSAQKLNILNEYLDGRSQYEFIDNLYEKYRIEKDDTTQIQAEISEEPTSSKRVKLLKKFTNIEKLTDIQAEYQSFQKINDIVDDCLTWWKKNETKFPRLAKLAKILFAIPATSAPSERVFSVAGDIIIKKRSNLSPFKINYLIFIHDNFKLIEN